MVFNHLSPSSGQQVDEKQVTSSPKDGGVIQVT